MKLRIEFPREVEYALKDILLVLLREFKPTKVTVIPSGGFLDYGPVIIIEGAEAINPFQVLEQIIKDYKAKLQLLDKNPRIRSLEFEDQKEKEVIDTWILAEKL